MEMLEFYKWTAIFSGIAFVVQLISSLFGFDSDTDTDASDMPDSAGDAHFGGVLLSFVSIRNVVSFLLAFSITGYFTMRDYGLGSASVLPGVAAGLLLVIFNMYLMRALSSLRRDTSVDEKELEGHEALVVFTILGNRAGQGKVNVNIADRRMTLFAITDDPDDLAKNTPVTIKKVLDGWIVLVTRQKSEDPNPTVSG